MRVVLQRVSKSSVSIDGKVHNKIDKGILVLLGIESGDEHGDADWLAHKISQLRIFSDSDGKMNQSIQDINGSFLVISQFTLHASTKKGNRPSFIRAASPHLAIPLYEYFTHKLEDVSGRPVKTGVFGADMKVDLLNDGPVTIFMDSKNKE
jgi:D-tyrosyl-tRNA(Tyr) deacylase